MDELRGALPPGLYALCDDGVCPKLSLMAKAERLLDGGVQTLQLRVKNTPWAEALSAARQIVALCRRRGARLIVNDRVDLALLAAADGVHLGEEDLPPALARKVLGAGRIVGVTVRGLDAARLARQVGADYVGLGPIFPSSTKPLGVPPLGVAALAEIAEQSPLPVVAISGIGLHNIEAVAAAGAHGAAVLSDVLTAEDIPSRARALGEAFANGRRRRTLKRA